MIANDICIHPAILLVFMFITVFGITSSADAQKVHALLVILGNDEKIRDSVNVNESNMKTLLRLLSENCEVQMTVMKSTDEITGGSNRKHSCQRRRNRQNTPKQLGIIKANQLPLGSETYNQTRRIPS